MSALPGDFKRRRRVRLSNGDVATNPIESVLATVRLTRKTKGCGTRLACETMVFKLVESAKKGWKRLNGSILLPELIRGVKFIDGEKVTEDAA